MLLAEMECEVSSSLGRNQREATSGHRSVLKVLFLSLWKILVIYSWLIPFLWAIGSFQKKKSVIYGWSTALILNFRSLNSIIHTSFSPNIMLLGAVIWHVTQRGGEKWVCQEADGMRKFSTMKRKEWTFQCTCDIKSKEWGLYILEL